MHLIPARLTAKECKWFNSAGGCWYGDTCKFKHTVQPTTTSPEAAPQPVDGSVPSSGTPTPTPKGEGENQHPYCRSAWSLSQLCQTRISSVVFRSSSLPIVRSWYVPERGPLQSYASRVPKPSAIISGYNTTHRTCPSFVCPSSERPRGCIHCTIPPSPRFISSGTVPPKSSSSYIFPSSLFDLGRQHLSRYPNDARNDG